MLGANGALYLYSDDVYLVCDLVSMDHALSAALVIYVKVGLRIGLGPGKTELILPPLRDPNTYTYIHAH